MPRINVSEVIRDPDFTQSFTVIRQTGEWTGGRFTTTEQPLSFTGVIIPLDTTEIVQAPEGDTIEGAIEIYTLKPLFTTRRAGKPWQKDQISDEVVWRGDNYKIMNVQNYQDYGYFKATAVRKFGA